jgi:hypothetical protein
MDISTSALSNRTMSAFPISIGTSLALESLFVGERPTYDPAREIPQHIDINEYTCFWVNLLTLYRNIIGSLQKDGAERVMAGDLWETLEFEVDLIKRVVDESSFGKTKAMFYFSQYENLDKHHPFATLRKATTEKQKQYERLMELSVNSYLKNLRQSDHIKTFKRKLQPDVREKALILTHCAYDLLSHPAFEKLDLIESHTGVRKGISLWYTKFANSKNLMRIPFNACFLQVFGDSQHFHPMAIKLREQVLALADEYNWSAMTTKDRLIFSFETLRDPHTSGVLKNMLSES